MDKEIETHNAIAIFRVSSIKQGLMGDSHNDQESQIMRRATQLSTILGIQIAMKKKFEYTQSASGEFDMQPILHALEYCKNPKNKIKYAFIKSIDRGTRGGATIYGQLKSQFARYGVQFVDVYGVIGTQNINTLEHLNISYKWSEFSPTWISELLEAERGKSEVRDILTRLIGAEIRYVREGYRVRPAPPGYKNEKIETPNSGKRVILAPNPIEAPWVIRMFELRIQGNLSDIEIVNEINATGYKSRKYRRHDPADSTRIIGYGGENPLTVKQLQKYLENPIYAGINTEKWTNGQPIKTRFKGLVTIDVFNKANRGKITIVEEGEQVKIYRGEIPLWQVKKDKNNPEFPYKNYVLCSICRKPLYGSAPRSKSGKHIPTYHCGRKHKYWGVNKKVFNETILSFIQKVHFTNDFIEKFNTVFLEEWHNREKQVSTVTSTLNVQVDNKEREIQLIKEKIKVLSSLETIKMFEEDIDRLKLEKTNLLVMRDKKEEEQLSIELLIATSYYFMEHLEDLLMGSPNPQQNAAMFGLLFEEIPTYEELNFGTPKLACLFKLNEEYNTSKSLSVSRQGLEP